MSNIVIDIAAEFTGKKAFSDTDKAVMKISKGAKKLGAALGLAFSTRAILAYSKASIKAAAADQKSQYILTTNLKNLGLAYSNVDSEAFIKSMETQTHIADDLLRPAYSQLAQVTGSIALTQKVMAIAFDTANGAGLDYSATIDILSQAYVGNRKGLKQLQTGLTTAQLAALSFDELLVVLTQHFGGVGKAAIKGYAGQMDALTISLGNVQEILGGALLDSFAQLAGEGDITKATSNIEKFAEAWAGVIRVLTGVYDINAILSQVEFGGFLGVVPKNKPASSIPMQSPGDRAAIDKANAKQLAVEKELAKLAKARAAAALAAAKAKKDQLALDKAALALAKGEDVFDMDKIQINAALLAKQSEINKLGAEATDQQKLQVANDLVRLTIKRDMLLLEDAIAAKDVAGATALAAKLNKDLAILAVLQGQNIKLLQINDILEAFEPKDLINLANLNEALRLLMAMAGVKISPLTGGTGGTGGSGGGGKGKGTGSLITGDFIQPLDKTTLLAGSLDALLEYADAATARANAMADLLDYQTQLDINAYNASEAAKYGGQLGMQNGTVVNISAGVIASPDEFARMVQKAVQNANRFGNNLDYAGGL